MSVLGSIAKTARGIFEFIDWVWCGVNSGREKVLDPLIGRMPPFITPNVLSWFRIVLACLIVVMLFWYDVFKSVIIVYFIVAVLSDMIDGQMARKNGLESDKGAFLDRLADKMLICPLVIYFLWADYKFLALPVVAVEFFSLFLLVGTESNVPAKWKMIAESVGIAIIFFFPQKILLACIAFGFAMAFGIESFREHRNNRLPEQNGVE